jgi:hypothetical protein
MKRLLLLFLTILTVLCLVCACTQETPADPGTEVVGGEAGTPPSGTPSGPSTDTPAGPSGGTPEGPDTPGQSGSGGSGGESGGGGGEEETTEISVSKTADEMANSIGKSANGDVVSGKDVLLDSNISVAFGKGSASTEPALYSGAIRVYQNGGTVTVKAGNGSALKTVIITCDSGKDGSGKLTV